MAFTPKTVVYDDELPPPDPKVGAGETFLNRAVNALPGGRPIVDTLSTAVMEGSRAAGKIAPGLSRALSGLPVVGQFAPAAESGVSLTPKAKAELEAMGSPEAPRPPEPGLLDTYRDMRDTRSQRTAAGSKQNPWAGRAGALTGFGLSLVAPLPKSSVAGWKGSAATGAGYGALAGLTDGKADLTRGEFGQALVDTAEGAALGGAMGAAGHGLMELGKRGVRALRGARADTLAQEQLAAREGAEAAQAQAAKAAEAERKMIGAAREMDKRVDAQRARELLRQARGGGGRSPAGAAEDPNTAVLQGYRGKAGERWGAQDPRVQKYMEELKSPNLAPARRERLQQYVDQHRLAVDDPAAFERQMIERYLSERFPNDPERVARIMRERVGPRAEILPRPAPAASQAADDVAAAADDAAGPSLAEEAEAMMAARRGEPPAAVASATPSPAPASGVRPPDAPWIPGAQTVQRQGPLTAPPSLRPGAGGMPYGGNLRRPLPPEEPVTELVTPSMAAPRDAVLPPDPTRAVTVPNIQRPAPRAAPTPAEPVTANLRPNAPAPAPAAPPAPRQMPVDDIQDVTRLAGPEDVGALAAERASSREAGAFGAVARAGYEGVRSGNSVLGAVFGGLAGIRREMLRDPAVKARALAAAKVHLLAQINPEVFARVGGQLAQSVVGGGGQYKAMSYVLARKDPAFREAEQKASEQASRMSDDQLMDLIADGAPPQ